MSHKAAWTIAAILLCTVVNFILSLAETSLASLRSSRLQRHVQGQAVAGEIESTEAIHLLLAHPTRVVAAVQLGITLMTVTATALGVVVVGPEVAPYLHARHVPDPIRLTVIGIVAVVTLLTLVVGEIVPRAVAMRNPEWVSLLVARPILGLERTLRPLVSIVLWLSNLLVRPFGLTASFQTPVVTEKELTKLLEASQSQGVIDEDEREMLGNVISFGDTEVHSVMTARTDMVAADVGTSATHLVDRIVACGHSRIPIYEGSVDNVIGVIHAKDLLMPLLKNLQNTSIRRLLRPAYFVPENKRVDDLLEEFRHSKQPLAIVQDEFGGTAGLVTIEDLVEEIVGEIEDEYDPVEVMVEQDGSGGAIVDGRKSLVELNNELDLNLPVDDYDTVGGLVFGLFGRVPTAGETRVFDDKDIEVLEADNRRVLKVRISEAAQGGEAEPGES